MNKPTYQAVVDLTFEGFNPPLRVETGKSIPDKVPRSELAQLLSDGHIREVTPAAIKESEDDK